MSDSSDQANTREHPFARFVRALGKGKSGSRSLSQAEAEQAGSLWRQRDIARLD